MVTRMESEIDQPSGSVVDSAMVPTKPASPNATLNLSVALALGFAFGIGLALIREAADRCVRTEHDLVEILGTPVLAVLSRKPVAYQNVRALKAPTTYSLPGP
jgi:capsular polysaccharide biosynthesis protein